MAATIAWEVSGVWGLVVCTIDNVKCLAGRVDPGVGTNSPYRSEAYGLLDGLRYAVATDLKGDIRQIIDNKAVVQVFQDCEERGPSLVCSQDVWDEIIWYKKYHRTTLSSRLVPRPS